MVLSGLAGAADDKRVAAQCPEGQRVRCEDVLVFFLNFPGVFIDVLKKGGVYFSGALCVF